MLWKTNTIGSMCAGMAHTGIIEVEGGYPPLLLFRERLVLYAQEMWSIKRRERSEP
jgi:hypothetical protein